VWRGVILAALFSSDGGSRMEKKSDEAETISE
jgi:hypothetical protein